MNRFAILMMVFVVALLAAALGVLGGAYLYHHRPFADAFLRGPGGPPRGEMGPGMPRGARLAEALPRLQRALDLSPEQVERLRPKLESTRREFATVRESLRARIESELTPAQRAKWRDIESRMPFPGRPGGPWPGADRPHRNHPDAPGEEGEPK